MRSLSARRPSPALVVACIALGIALGGTGYATVLQVPRNSVGTAQLKSSAVTTKKLAANAVTSAKVRNGTLLPADFKAGSLPAGPTGPAGATGPPGPPGVSAVERVEVTSPSSSVGIKQQAIPCPGGKRLLGGGARLNGGGQAVALQQSFPDNDNVFRAMGREIVGTNASWSITVFAVCAVTG
jgi:hypothetical protein